MSVKIEATGKTMADALAAFAHTNLTNADTDALIAELRERMVAQKPPMVVRIVPFAESA